MVEQSAFLVGMVGLVQFLPLFALTFIAGATADRRDRRMIMMACLGLETVCVLILAGMALHPSPSLVPVFAVASVFGGLARLHPAGRRSHDAHAGGARADAARHRLELPRLHLGRGHRPLDRRRALRRLACGGLSRLGWALRRRLGHPVDDPGEHPPRSPAGLAPGDDPRGNRLCLADQDRARRHLAGPVRRAAGRGHRACCRSMRGTC